jgi:hypothetical protein
MAKCETGLLGKTVRLTVVPDEGEAEMLCRMLRLEGIPCGYRGSDLSVGGSDAGYAFGGWREILVDDNDLARARELLPKAD